MALTWEDVAKLPDDVKYKLPDGTEVTLGDLRAAADGHVNKRIADLTPREQKLSTKEKELSAQEQALAAREQSVREAVAALSTTPNNPPPPVDPSAATLGFTPAEWAAIQNDPFTKRLFSIMGAVVEQNATMNKRLEDTTKNWDKYTAEQKQREEQWWINSQFDRLATTDPRYKDPEFRKEVLNKTMEVIQRRDITAMDKALHFDERIKSHGDSEYQRGLKEGMSKAPIPAVPYGLQPLGTPPEPPKLPADFREFQDNATVDQDLINEMRKAATEPLPPGSTQ